MTQTPKDVPADVLAQLGNRVQHALRAFTPDDAKALRATARTFPTSDYDLEKLLTGLGTGEAVVTVLTEKGAPTPVAWTRLRAPQGSMDPAPEATMTAIIDASPANAQYGTAVDNVSAYEMLAQRIDEEREAREAAERAAAEAEQAEKDRIAAEKKAEKDRIAAEKQSAKEAEAAEKARIKTEQTAAAKAAKEAERNARSQRAGIDSLLRSGRLGARPRDHPVDLRDAAPLIGSRSSRRTASSSSACAGT